jgi:hypothetical protein
MSRGVKDQPNPPRQGSSGVRQAAGPAVTVPSCQPGIRGTLSPTNSAAKLKRLLTAEVAGAPDGERAVL